MRASTCTPDATRRARSSAAPSRFRGISVFGKLNRQSMTLAAADQENGTIDVYQYSPTALTYWYSISNGLGVSYTVNGVSQNPRSKQ